MADRVSAKLEEGDFKGAVRLASSDDTLAPMNEATYQALLERHPPPHPNSVIPPIDEAMSSNAISVDEGEVVSAIRSFKRGSAGGPDGLRPQHLTDMVSIECGHQPALTAFVRLVLEGRTPVCPFFGANLDSPPEERWGCSTHCRQLHTPPTDFEVGWAQDYGLDGRAPSSTTAGLWCQMWR